MSEWRAKRSWTLTEIMKSASGYLVALDGRPVRTPAEQVLLLPTRSMAERICAEWEAQTAELDPAAMPFTRLANLAADRAGPARGELTAAISAFAECDLLCHRAVGPAELVSRQRNAWDPIVAWSAATFGAKLTIGSGVMPIRQSGSSLAALSAEVERQGPYELAGLSEMVALTGSLLLGLAVLAGRLAPEAGWQLSRIDESHQIEMWGADCEAAAAARARRSAFLVACEFTACA